MRPLWHIDEPTLLTPRSDDNDFVLSGWVAAFDEIDEIVVESRAADGTPVLDLTRYERDDVPPVLGIPGLRAVGFRGNCRRRRVESHDAIELAFRSGGSRSTTWVPVSSRPPHSIDNKARKLSNLLPLLQCPTCRAGPLSLDPESFGCSSCGTPYRRSPEHIDFLTDEVRASFGLSETENVSENAYDGEIVGIIGRHHRGWVLDCGAGKRQHYYEHVVNFEIAPYDTTDVLGVGERLPFRDGVFDAVLSVAVLEHVRNPFACAEELLRVLRPGGTLYCQLPFIQPYHGYPHHYFNATQSGLEVLFRDRLDVERLAVLDFGQPVAALSWILQRYVEGLPADQHEGFLDMKVRDFLRPTATLLGEAFVRNLSEEKKSALACCNVLVGTKRPVTAG